MPSSFAGSDTDAVMQYITIPQAKARGISVQDYLDYNQWTSDWLKSGTGAPTLIAYMIGAGLLSTDDQINRFVRIYNANLAFNKKSDAEFASIQKVRAVQAAQYEADVAAGKYDGTPPPFGYDPLGRPIYTIEQHAAVTNNIGNLRADAAEIARQKEEASHKSVLGTVAGVLTGSILIEKIPVAGNVFANIDPVQGVINDGVSGFADNIVNSGKVVAGLSLAEFTGGVGNVASIAKGGKLDKSLQDADPYTLGLASGLGNLSDVSNKALSNPKDTSVKEVAIAELHAAEIGGIVAASVVGISEIAGVAGAAGAAAEGAGVAEGVNAGIGAIGGATEGLGGTVAAVQAGKAAESGSFGAAINFGAKSGVKDELPINIGDKMGIFDNLSATVDSLKGNSIGDTTSKFSNVGDYISQIQSVGAPELVSFGANQLGNLTPAQIEAGIKGAASTLGGGNSGSANAVAAGATIGNSKLPAVTKAALPVVAVLAVIVAIYFFSRGK